MLAALSASAQTASAFARTTGIGLHRVNYWRKRLGDGRAPEAGTDGGFVAVEVGDDASDRDGPPDRRVEVTLANGRRVAFAGTWDAAAITPWLRALEDTRCSG